MYGIDNSQGKICGVLAFSGTFKKEVPFLGQLPTALEIGGQDYTINPDFRNILTIFEAFGDTSLTDGEKAYICLKRLYISNIPYKLVI